MCRHFGRLECVGGQGVEACGAGRAGCGGVGHLQRSAPSRATPQGPRRPGAASRRAQLAARCCHRERSGRPASGCATDAVTDSLAHERVADAHPHADHHVGVADTHPDNHVTVGVADKCVADAERVEVAVRVRLRQRAQATEVTVPDTDGQPLVPQSEPLRVQFLLH